MIALDTNVLVRYLVEDEPADQCERAAALIEGTLDSGTPIFLSNIVLCELVWVLESCYGLPGPQIADTLERLIETEQLRFTEPSLLHRAVDDYRSSRGDFADFLIRELARSHGCSTVATFDQALLDHDDFVEP